MYRAKPNDSTDFAPNLTPQMAQPHCKRPNDWIESYTKNVGCTEQNPVTQLILRRILHHKWLSLIVSDPMTELNLTPKNVGCTVQNPVTQLILRRILHHKWLSRIVSDPMTELNLTPKMLGVQSKTQWLNWFVPNLTPQMAQPHSKRPNDWIESYTKNVGCTEQTQWLNWFCAESYTTNGSAAFVSDPMTELNLTPKMLGVRSKTSDSTDFVPNLTPQMAQPHSKRPQWMNWILHQNVGCTEQNPVTQLILCRILHHKWLKLV